MLALHDTCSERPPKIARSHRPWFPAEHLVTQRENLLCATADLLLQHKSDQISKTDQGPALREQGKRTGRPENTVCFMVKKKKKKKFYGENSSEEKWWATETSGCYFKYSGQVLAVCYPICLPYYNLSSRNQASHIESTKYTLNEGMKVAEGHPIKLFDCWRNLPSITIPDRCICG